MKSFNQDSLSEWLQFFGETDRIVSPLRLEHVRALAERLNVLQMSAPVITVTGTNGKGSTVQALEAIYRAAGYNVGKYTSPHLFRYNERICVNGVPIADDLLCYWFKIINEVRRDVALSFFEWTTLAAWLYFKSQPLDIIVLEVGVGGRQDTTNIIDADVAIITTVDFDHQALLGNTKDEIGYEKAGIFRANRPAIYADYSPPDSIIACANQLNTSLHYLDQDFYLEVMPDHLTIKTTINRNEFQSFQLPRPIIHSHAALAAVIASDCLKARLPITACHWEQAMRSVHIPGRLQVLPGRVMTLFDVSHNPQAVRLLSESLRPLAEQGHVHAVFSALQDKDLHALIKAMQPMVNYWYPAQLATPRAASEHQIMEAFLATIGESFEFFNAPRLAYQKATQMAKENDIIVVFGSFFTVSDVMMFLNLEGGFSSSSLS